MEPNPFFEPNFALAALRSLPGRDEPQLLYVEDGERLVFAMPVIQGARFRRGPIRPVTSWRHLFCFLGTPLVARGTDPAVWGAAFETLAERRSEPWLFLDLVGADGPVRASCDAFLADSWVHSRSALPRTRATVVRRPEPNYLTGRMSGDNRKNLRRRRRRLEEQLGAPLEVVDRARRRWDGAVDDFMRLEASGWKGRQGRAIAVRPGHADFFRRLCDSYQREGRLQLLSLESTGRPVAMACNVIAGDAVFCFKVGYDDHFARYSPGLQLELDVLAVFHDDPGVEWLDSCSSETEAVPNRLFPDRRPLDALLVELTWPRGGWGVRAFPVVSALRGLPRGRRPRRSQVGES